MAKILKVKAGKETILIESSELTEKKGGLVRPKKDSLHTTQFKDCQGLVVDCIFL